MFLLERLPEHEEEEEAVVYPVVAEAMGGEDPLSSMAPGAPGDRAPRADLSAADRRPAGRGPDAEDLMDLRRVLYGLHAILRLHFAQEEEAYAWLASSDDEFRVGRRPG